MKSKLGWIGLLIVPVFGLVSCSRDSAENRSEGNREAAGKAPVIDSVQDTWKLSHPVIHITRDGVTRTLKFTDQNIGAIDPGAEVEIKLKNSESAEGVTINADSTCSAAHGPKRSSLVLKNKLRFPLINLIHADIYRGLDSQTPLTCSMNFRVTNALGSSHQFSVSHQIDKPLGLETLALEPSETVAAEKASQLGFKGPTQPSANGRIELFCDSQSNVRPLHLNSSWSTVLNELINGTSLSDPGAANARLQYPKQQCRIVISSGGSDSEPSLVKMTPKFTLRYPPNAADLRKNDVALFSKIDDVGFLRINQSEVFNFSVENQSPVAMAFRVSNLHGAQARYEMLETQNGRAIRGYPFESSLEMEISGASQNFSEGPDSIFEVLPGRRASVRGTFRSNINCKLFCVGNSGVCGGLVQAGFVFQLSRPLEINQYLSWSSSRPNLNGETFPLSTRNGVSVVGPTSSQIWVPAPRWTEINPRNEMPNLGDAIPKSGLSECGPNLEFMSPGWRP